MRKLLDIEGPVIGFLEKGGQLIVLSVLWLVCCLPVVTIGAVHHFLYSNNGRGTPGHIRRPEAEKMAEELSAYIESLGEEIWEDEA